MSILFGTVLTAASLLAAPAAPAPIAAPASQTAGELAACATAADQPVCLLKVAARQPHLPYRYDIRLAYAPQLLAAIGDDEAAASKADPHSFAGLLALEVADRPYATRMVAEVLDADRRGEAPAAALARLDTAPPPPPFSDNPKLTEALKLMVKLGRADAEEQIVAAYVGPKALPAGHRPSAALAQAALADWARFDAEVAPAWTDYRVRLAKAQVLMGELGEALKTDARIGGPKGLGQGWAALHAGRLEQAAAAAAAVRPSGGEDDLDDYEQIAGLRGEVISALEAASRQGLAGRVAAATLSQSVDRRDELDPVRTLDADAAMAVLIRDGSRAEVADWAARLDPAGRNLESPQSAKNALAAARAWEFLGETGKARALGVAWVTTKPWKPFLCGEDKSQACNHRMVRQIGIHNDALMLVVRVLPPGDLMASGMSPVTGLSLDIEDGRGAGRLQAWLDFTSPRKATDTLVHCVWLAGERGAIAEGHACLDRVLPHVPPAAYYAAHPVEEGESMAVGLGRYLLRMAAVAARQGQMEEMRRDLDAGLELLSRTPGQPLKIVYPADLVDIAIAELRAQGRL